MENLKKLAVITTHPIQYNVPFFRLLAKEFRLKVFYTWSQRENQLYDRTFQRDIQWDIPLMEGYDYEFVRNISRKPGSHHFWGIVNPSVFLKIRKYNPEYILVYGWSFLTNLLILLFPGKRKIIFRGDSSVLDMGNDWKTQIKRTVLKWIYGRVNWFHYTGENNRKYFEACGVQASRLVFAPHAVENDRFFESYEKDYESRAKQWRSELGIRDDQTVILFAGKFETKKDPALLIRAFLLLDNPSVKLVLVGSGPLEVQLNQLAAGQPGIQFLPFQNQSVMPVVYRLGDLFCYPSRGPNETWGLAVNEAMACSRPVLVSDKVGCAIDLVQEGVTGMIFHHGDVDDLVAILKVMVSNRSELKKMGDHARKTIGNWNYTKDLEAIQRVVN